MIDVIIPVYGQPGLTSNCLQALTRAWIGDGTVFLVDDASPYADSLRIKEALSNMPMRTRYLTNTSNLGFLRSVNNTVKYCQQPCIMLLNSDVVIPAMCLQQLCEVFAAYPNTAAVAPVSDNRTDLFQYREDASASMADLNSSAPAINRFVNSVPYLTAMCLAMRSDVFRQVGLFDEIYSPGYFEDLDLSCRLRSTGYTLMIREDCRAHHVGHASFRKFTGLNDLISRNFATFSSRWGHLSDHRELVVKLFPGVASC